MVLAYIEYSAGLYQTCSQIENLYSLQVRYKPVLY